VVEAALDALDAGKVRVAEPGPDGWRVNQWLKKAVLLSFRLTDSAPMEGPGGAPRGQTNRIREYPLLQAGPSPLNRSATS
jgi:tetrahydrodipicolinate N-succinyltransferase